MDKAFQIVEETNTLLDEPDNLKGRWYASKDSIESAKQMRITAQGYIDSMEATQKALSNCVIQLFNMTRPPEVELAKSKVWLKRWDWISYWIRLNRNKRTPLYGTACTLSTLIFVLSLM